MAGSESGAALLHPKSTPHISISAAGDLHLPRASSCNAQEAEHPPPSSGWRSGFCGQGEDAFIDVSILHVTFLCTQPWGFPDPVQRAFLWAGRG